MYEVGEIIVAKPRGNVARFRGIIANAKLACNVAGTGGVKDVVGGSCAQGCINFLLTSAILQRGTDLIFCMHGSQLKIVAQLGLFGRKKYNQAFML